MSYLVERHRDGHDNVGSHEVADARNFSKPLAAKILTTLSKIGIVTGSTGPSGGYRLAKPAADISLLDVLPPSELQNKAMTCPFGEGWCGNHEHCPLHDRIVELEEQQLKFFNENTFEGFDHCGYSFKTTSLITSIKNLSSPGNSDCMKSHSANCRVF